ncbi:hypothetical protein [Paraburkholderia sp. MM5384-R2]|uniref:hypothetical protein n=1 Tax=Paraburkholderia sp. MM5384-R2 TaxID=2723097 RepID=UPI00161E3907|nr:hypothetical protein [Paraburkholderia sp. MM5384-R2]MBB5496865.1 hypothetical protein [Paraburkholderia sp. MM5384-R2]
MNDQFFFAIVASLVLWLVIYLVRRVSQRKRFFRLIGKEFPRSNVYVRGWGGVAVDVKNERFAVCKKDCLDWFDASQILDVKVEHTKSPQLQIPYMTIDVTLRSERLPALRIEAQEFDDLLNIGSLLKILVENKESANKTKVAEIDFATQIVELIYAVNRLTAAVTSLTDVASTSTITLSPGCTALSASRTQTRKARRISRSGR